MEEALNAYLEEQGENVRIDLDPIDGNNLYDTGRYGFDGRRKR